MSFQDINGFVKVPPNLIPASFTIKNYKILLFYEYALQFFLNTILYSIISASGAIVFSLMTSFLLVYGKKKNVKKALLVVLTIGYIIPRFALTIPQYILLSRLSLLNTVFAITLPAVYSIYGVFITKSYLETVPKSFYEIAQVDGATDWQILIKIIMPLCKSVLAAEGVFQAINVASDFLWQTLIITDKAKNTLIAGLPLVMRENIWTDGLNMGKPIGLQITGSVIMFLPLLMYFIIGNKFYRKLDLSYKE